MQPDDMRVLAHYRMPFGKHAGSYLVELPESYLVWFKGQGWPRGRLGEMMQLAYEVRLNGLQGMLREIRRRYPPPAS